MLCNGFMCLSFDGQCAVQIFRVKSLRIVMLYKKKSLIRIVVILPEEESVNTLGPER